MASTIYDSLLCNKMFNVPVTGRAPYLEMDPHVPPRVADDRECAAGATTGGGCLFLLGSDSSGLDSCSTDRDSEELSMDLENAFNGDSVGLQSFGVVAAASRRYVCRCIADNGALGHSRAFRTRIGRPIEIVVRRNVI